MVRNWLKQRRTDLHLSQEELATLLQLRGLDISRATVSHWEMGKYPPPFDNAVFVNALAGILKLSVIEVLAHAGYDLAIEGLSETERHIIDAVRRGDKVEAIKTIVNE